MMIRIHYIACEKVKHAMEIIKVEHDIGFWCRGIREEQDTVLNRAPC